MKPNDYIYYICLTNSTLGKGRFTIVVDNVWYWSVSRSSAIRIIRFMKTKHTRKTEPYINSSGERWIYWWF